MGTSVPTRTAVRRTCGPYELQRGRHVLGARARGPLHAHAQPSPQRRPRRPRHAHGVAVAHREAQLDVAWGQRRRCGAMAWLLRRRTSVGPCGHGTWHTAKLCGSDTACCRGTSATVQPP